MLTSTANAKVKQVVNWQTKAKDRRRDGVFLIEGIKMYMEAPVGAIREVYVSQALLERLENEQGSKAEKLKNKLRETGCEVVSETVFAKMSDTASPQGILVVMDRPGYTLDELLGATKPLLLILEDIQDPGNLGTILRTGEGAGVTGVIMSRNTVDIYNPKTIRSTMGSVYRVPFLYTEDLEETIDRVKDAGIRVYAAHLKGEREYDEFDYTEGTAFLIGNEANGLSKEIADQADAYLRIPMEGQVESLNAAICASLLLYEVHRQRKSTGK